VHELSIVLNIIEISEQEARTAGGESISSIELDIGKLSTIEPAAFDFAWKQGVRGSMLEQAKLITNYIPGKGRCSSCGTVFDLNALYDPCPECGEYLAEVVEGKELKIKSIRIEEKLVT
jgi:hydrogenase nickel incorporation protein HypA/HybF